MTITFNNSIQKKALSKNAIIKQKSNYALFAIWVFVFITIINVYFTNVQYLTENKNSNDLNQSISFNNYLSNTNSTGTTGKQNYALVQYNKKLILTRFTGIIAPSNSNSKGNTGSGNNSKGQNIIVIKNQQSQKPASNNEFSVKPIPNN